MEMSDTRGEMKGSLVAFFLVKRNRVNCWVFAEEAQS